MRIAYVYALVDGRTREPFYVGKTVDTGARLAAHMATYPDRRPSLIILEESSPDVVHAREAEWTQRLRRAGP